MSKVLPLAEPSPVAECQVSRRESVRRIGSWVIYAGVLGGSTAIGAACGRTPLGFPFGDGNPTDTPSLTPTPTLTATPSATPTGGASCACSPAGGTDTNLTTSDIPVNGVAYSSGYFICHDSLGFYAMSAVCTHLNSNDMGLPCNQGSSGGTFSSSNLAGGFMCCYHGSKFDGNGNVTNGPATLPLQHYLLTIDSTNQHLLLDLVVQTEASCRCT